MQPSTAVIINNCYAHWRPYTSVMFLHWSPALRWRLFSRVVNPGNPAISRHVVRRKPPIALENKNCRRKETKYQGKVNFFVVHVKKNIWLLRISSFWSWKLSNFGTHTKLQVLFHVMHCLRGARVQWFRSAQVSSAQYCSGYYSGILSDCQGVFNCIHLHPSVC